MGRVDNYPPVPFGRNPNGLRCQAKMILDVAMATPATHFTFRLAL